jgi:hypothetical protein
MTEEPEPRLERLVAPPAGQDFHTQLWERIGDGERASRRRRRTLIAVAAAAALLTVSAAGVFAYGQEQQPLDRTISCPVPEQGGVNVLYLTAHVKAPPVTYGTKAVPRPAVALVEAGDQVVTQLQYAGVTAVRGGYLFDQTVCHTAPAIPLTRAGLHAVGTYTGSKGDGADRECWLAPIVSIRMHVKLGRSGAPVAAKIAVRSGAKLHPVAYIDWTPTRITAYVSPSCQVR